jgi:hypothetical protein
LANPAPQLPKRMFDICLALSGLLLASGLVGEHIADLA